MSESRSEKLAPNRPWRPRHWRWADLWNEGSRLRIAARRDAEEIALLRSIVGRAVPVINQSRSAYVQGSQSDSEWHMQVEQWLADARAALGGGR